MIFSKPLNHLALALMIGVSLAATPAEAARMITADVSLDGKVILTATTSDNGHPDVDAVWERLKKLTFKPTAEFAKLGFEDDAKTATLGAQQPGPLRVKLRIAYGGMIQCRVLKLVRVPVEPTGGQWRVAAAEVDRLFNARLISRREAARLVTPRREKR